MEGSPSHHGCFYTNSWSWTWIFNVYPHHSRSFNMMATFQADQKIEFSHSNRSQNHIQTSFSSIFPCETTAILGDFPLLRSCKSSPRRWDLRRRDSTKIHGLFSGYPLETASGYSGYIWICNMMAILMADDGNYPLCMKKLCKWFMFNGYVNGSWYPLVMIVTVCYWKWS